MASTKNGTNQSEYLQADTADATINGFGGDDSMYAPLGGTNFLNGGDGNDLLIGGPGSDHMDGGPGDHDTASYRFSSAGVNASLSNPGSNTGDAARDTYTGVEDLEGTNFNDVLVGDNQPVNTIQG